MEEEIKDLKREIFELEKVVLINKGMLLYICRGLKMSTEEIDSLEEMCEGMVENAFKEYEEEVK